MGVTFLDYKICFSSNNHIMVGLGKSIEARTLHGVVYRRLNLLSNFVICLVNYFNTSTAVLHHHMSLTCCTKSHHTPA